MDKVEHAFVAQRAAKGRQKPGAIAEGHLVQAADMRAPKGIALALKPGDDLVPFLPRCHVHEATRTTTRAVNERAHERAKLSASMSGSKAFHGALQLGDTETTTVGCRHTNPDICGKNQMPKVCAFARADGMCSAPPASWPRQFRRLQVLQNASNRG